MAVPVVLACMCTCTNGTVSSPIMVSQFQILAGNKPAATIMHKPQVPFGMCNNPMNPAVQAATAAAAGVPTMAPCTLALPAPWTPGSPTVLIKNKPALNSSSKLMCAYGGMISVVPNTPKVNVR